MESSNVAEAKKTHQNVFALSPPNNESFVVSVSLEERVRRLEQMLVDPHSSCYLEGLLDTISGLVEDTRHLAKCKSNRLLNNVHERLKQPAQQIQQYRLRVSDFEVVKALGKGAFGEVQLVRHAATREVFAMKVLSKKKMLEQPGSARFWEERDIMAKAQSQWIVKLFYAMQDESNLYMVMEFMAGNNLSTWLDQMDSDVAEEDALFYIAECVLGLETLHKLGYIHRDVKPANVLLDHRGHVKLADFGTALLVDPVSKRAKTSDAVGTPDFLSPEVLNCQGDESADIGCEVDWWALGCMLFEMLYVDPPFYSDSLAQTYNMIMNHIHHLKFPPAPVVRKETQQLIQGLLSEASQRLGRNGALEIQSHPCFHNMTWSWDDLHHHTPPFIPNLQCDTDTVYFSLSDLEDVEEDDASSQVPTVLTQDQLDVGEKTYPLRSTMVRAPKPFTGEQLNFSGFSFTCAPFSLFSRHTHEISLSHPVDMFRRREDTSSGVSTASSQITISPASNVLQDTVVLQEQLQQQLMEIEDLNVQLNECMEEREILVKERRLISAAKSQCEHDKELLEVKFEEMKQAHQELQSKSENLQERLASTQRDYQKVVLDNSLLETTVKTFKTQLEEAEQSVQYHVSLVEDLQARYQETLSQKSQVQEDLQQSQSQCAFLQKHLASLQLDLEALQAKCTQAVSQRTDLASQEDDFRQERERLQEENVSLEKTCRNLRVDFARMMQAHESLLRKEEESRRVASDLREQLDNLHEVYEIYRQSRAKDEGKWQEERCDLLREKEQLTMDIQEMKEFQQHLVEVKENLLSDLKRRKEVARADRKQLKATNERVEELEVELAKMKRREKMQADAYRKEINEVEERTVEQEQRNKRFQKVFLDLKAELTAKEETIYKLSRELQQAKINSSQLVNKLNTIVSQSRNKDQLMSLASKDAEAKTAAQEVKRLRNELHEERQLLAGLRKEHGSLKDEMLERCAALEQERDEIQRQLEMSQQQCQEWQRYAQDAHETSAILQTSMRWHKTKDHDASSNRTRSRELEVPPNVILRQKQTLDNAQIPSPPSPQSLSARQQKELMRSSWTVGLKRGSFSYQEEKPNYIAKSSWLSSNSLDTNSVTLELESHLDVMGGLRDMSSVQSVERRSSISLLNPNGVQFRKLKKISRQKKTEWQPLYAKILLKEGVLAFFSSPQDSKPLSRIPWKQMMFIRKATEADALHAKKSDIERIFQVIYDLDLQQKQQHMTSFGDLVFAEEETLEFEKSELQHPTAQRRMSAFPGSGTLNLADVESVQSVTLPTRRGSIQVDLCLKEHKFQPMVFRTRQHCQICNEVIGRLLNPPTALQCVHCLLKMCSSHAVTLSSQVKTSNSNQKLPSVPACSQSVGSYLFRAPTAQMCEQWLKTLMALQEQWPAASGRSKYPSTSSSTSTLQPSPHAIARTVSSTERKTSEDVAMKAKSNCPTVRDYREARFNHHEGGNEATQHRVVYVYRSQGHGNNSPLLKEHSQ